MRSSVNIPSLPFDSPFLNMYSMTTRFFFFWRFRLNGMV